MARIAQALKQEFREYECGSGSQIEEPEILTHYEMWLESVKQLFNL